jgi:hypothetical protein
VLGIVGFVLGALVGTAGAGEQPVRTVTVTSIVTSIVTAAPTTQPATTPTTGPPPTTRRPTTSAPPTTRRPPVTAPPTTRRPATTRTSPPARACDPSYPDFCIPPPPPDLDCPDLSRQGFTVVGADPHRFDADNDGLGCEP